MNCDEKNCGEWNRVERECGREVEIAPSRSGIYNGRVEREVSQEEWRLLEKDELE